MPAPIWRRRNQPRRDLTPGVCCNNIVAQACKSLGPEKRTRARRLPERRRPSGFSVYRSTRSGLVSAKRERGRSRLVTKARVCMCVSVVVIERIYLPRLLTHVGPRNACRCFADDNLSPLDRSALCCRQRHGCNISWVSGRKREAGTRSEGAGGETTTGTGEVGRERAVRRGLRERRS